MSKSTSNPDPSPADVKALEDAIKEAKAQFQKAKTYENAVDVQRLTRKREHLIASLRSGLRIVSNAVEAQRLTRDQEHLIAAIRSGIRIIS